MEALITKHATKRLKKRLGLRKKAQYRHVMRVLERGVIEAQDIEKRILYVSYDSRKYIFEDYKGITAILITVFPKEKKLNIANNYLSPISVMELGEFKRA